MTNFCQRMFFYGVSECGDGGTDAVLPAENFWPLDQTCPAPRIILPDSID